jgi:hypothetical protein
MLASPSIAENPDNGALVVTFQSNDQYRVLVQTTGFSQQTITSPAPTFYDNIRMGSSPSMIATPGFPTGYSMYLAFKSNDSYNWFFITESY